LFVTIISIIDILNTKLLSVFINFVPHDKTLHKQFDYHPHYGQDSYHIQYQVDMAISTSINYKITKVKLHDNRNPNSQQRLLFIWIS